MDTADDTIFYLADPAWLDAVVAFLMEAPATLGARRRMAGAIVESGSIGPDGRVQLFFAPPAFEEFMSAARDMGSGRPRHRGHFSNMAATPAPRP